MTLKIEAGKRYRTRGGDEVEVLRTDINSADPVLGVITYKNSGGQSAISFKEDGSYLGEMEYSHDLISEIRPKRVVWLNVYEEDEGASFFSSRQEADADYLKWRATTPARIACVRVEFEENQFDD